MTQQARQAEWQRFAGSIAENYNRHLVPAIFRPWAEELVALAAPRPGKRVLDVACGTGAVTRLAARRAGAEQVTGLDIPGGLWRTRRKGTRVSPGRSARCCWLEPANPARVNMRRLVGGRVSRLLLVR